MNRTRLMMIGALALAIAFLVSVTVYKNLQGKMGSSDPGVQVMVAANDLQVGSRVEEHDSASLVCPLRICLQERRENVPTSLGMASSRPSRRVNLFSPIVWLPRMPGPDCRL